MAEEVAGRDRGGGVRVGDAEPRQVAPYGRVEVDPATTALIVVDMQRDFVHPEGALPVPGALDTVPRIRKLLDWAREQGIFVTYTQDSHYPDDPEWEIWGRHVEHGTPGWEIVDELAPQPGELVFEKARYDGFYGTGLDHALRTRGIHYTAASAALRWYKVIHPVDALSALTEFDYHSALRQAAFLFNARLTTVDGLV